MKTALKWLWLSLIAILIDLGVKQLVVERFELSESINLLPFFNLTYARNYGAAFSFLADQSGWQTYFFLGLALFISGFLTYLLYQNKAKSQWENVGYALIIGGGLANGIDRAFRGYVDEFFELNPKLKGKIEVIERPEIDTKNPFEVRKEIEERKEIHSKFSRNGAYVTRIEE